MLASEIIYNIKNLKAAGIQSDDVKLSDAQYLFIIDYYRAKLVREEFNRTGNINPFYEQSLGKVLLDKNGDEYCGGTNYKPKKAIPTPIVTNTRTLITFVGNTPVSEYARSSMRGLSYIREDKYVKMDSVWLPYENSFIINGKGPHVACYVRGIWESPLAVEKYLNKYNAFKPYDFEYNITNAHLDTILKMVVDGEIKVSTIFPMDTTNDGQEPQPHAR